MRPNPSTRPSFHWVALTIWLWWTGPLPADACTICIGLPQESDADHLVESHTVVLARENPDRPFSFAPVEVLKGNFDGRDIDLLVDSVTRRLLAADPRRKVVLVQRNPGGPWRSLGLARDEYEAVVRRVVLVAPSWAGAGGRGRRVEFFTALFGHENPQIYRLAYLEVGRAPYRVIRRLAQGVSRDQFAAMLDRPQYVDWRPLAILMLAQSRDANDVRRIRESFRTAERWGHSNNLAAWATAAVELDGPHAISYIVDHYFRQAGRKPEELEQVIKALSLHGTEGRTELRDRIVAAYGVLLEVHPGAAEAVARDLLAWERTELAGRLRAIEASRTPQENAASEAVRHYLQVVAGTSGQ